MRLSILDEHRAPHFCYKDMSMMSLIIKNLQECRQSKRFIDFEVQVGDTVFPCHRVVLDAVCPYFASLYSFHDRGDYGHSGEMERVTLKYSGVTVTGFSRLLDFMYTSCLEEVTVQDAIDILRCADFLQFHKGVHLCSVFLQQHISADTCLEILLLAQVHELDDLADMALSFILCNLAEVIRCQPVEFSQLVSQDLLVKIVSSDYLDVKSEEVTLKGILAWIKGNEQERSQLLPALIQHARLHASDISQLRDKLQQEAFCLEDGNHIFENCDKCLLENLKPSSLPNRLTEAVVAICRETQIKHRGKVYCHSNIYFYHIGATRWEVLTQLPFTDRQDYAAAVVNNVLYLTGGRDVDLYDMYSTQIVFNESWAYDPVLDAWQERKMMMIPRYNHSAACVQRKLYVVGGRHTTGYGLRGDGEVYDPDCDQWTRIKPVNGIEGIANVALAALDGKLYMCGGTRYDSKQDVPYETFLGAQVYNPKKNEWQDLQALEHEFTMKRVRASRGLLLALEGFLLFMTDDIGQSHKLFNPVTRVLTSLMKAHGHHWFGGWVMLQSQLMCVGGITAKRDGYPTDAVHAWDLTVPRDHMEQDAPRIWKVMPSLPIAASHMTCLNMHLRLPRPKPSEAFSSSS